MPGSELTYVLTDDSIIVENSADNDDLVIGATNYVNKSPNNDDIIVMDLESSPTVPIDTCPICLDNIKSLSFTYPCFHKFCKRCITSWHLISVDCPVCKQKSSRLIYDVRTSTDYKEIPVKLKERGESNRRTYRDRVGRRQCRVRNSYGVTDISGPEHLGRSSLIQSLHPDVEDPEGTSLRRQIYRRTCPRLTSSYSALRSGSVRIARNKPKIDRLTPWVKREVHAIMPSISDHNFITSVIIYSIKQYELDSPHFRMAVLPFFAENTDIFIDELLAFNSSTLPMDAYDRNTIYAGIPMASLAPRNGLSRRNR